MERASGRQAHEGSTERQTAERREQGGRDLPRHPGTCQGHHAERQRQEQQGSPPAVDDGRHGDRGEQGSGDRQRGSRDRWRTTAAPTRQTFRRGASPGPRAPRPETVGPRGARVRADWGAPQAPFDHREPDEPGCACSGHRRGMEGGVVMRTDRQPQPAPDRQAVGAPMIGKDARYVGLAHLPSIGQPLDDEAQDALVRRYPAIPARFR